ncbi:MAG: hypothetical protein COX30_03535 [Candidatus Moranbacteria bacterium CG23_combo_of_CG06-09_8_20_14_all_39_10]|nr:MAG: hypothetical protein COX30_03535 [Candidatus Moranbacteria bacterium CG23_combo_of_CG06-09_8_20_14_all_39_10]
MSTGEVSCGGMPNTTRFGEPRGSNTETLVASWLGQKAVKKYMADISPFFVAPDEKDWALWLNRSFD